MPIRRLQWVQRYAPTAKLDPTDWRQLLEMGMVKQAHAIVQAEPWIKNRMSLGKAGDLKIIMAGNHLEVVVVLLMADVGEVLAGVVDYLLQRKGFTSVDTNHVVLMDLSFGDWLILKVVYLNMKLLLKCGRVIHTCRSVTDAATEAKYMGWVCGLGLPCLLCTAYGQ